MTGASSRAANSILIACFVGAVLAQAEDVSPSIPAPAEVARYERVLPVFRSVKVSKERGDALLAALDGGKAVKKWRMPPGVICALPVEEGNALMVTLTNGVKYRIGVGYRGGLLYLPEGLYQVPDAAKERVVAFEKQMEDDLRREIREAVKPCKYRLGTADDGGTLSGVALVAYGDARKWRRILDANRAVIKNPNSMNGSEMITLPKLE